MSSRKSRSPWVQAVMKGVDPDNPEPHVRCTRCGSRFVTVLPMRIEDYIALTRAFERLHRQCPA
jgi:hypothetical protein